MSATCLLTKQCSKCRLIKPVEEFNFRHRVRGVRHGYCRECGKELTRRHYRLKSILTSNVTSAPTQSDAGWWLRQSRVLAPTVAYSTRTTSWTLTTGMED